MSEACGDQRQGRVTLWEGADYPRSSSDLTHQSFHRGAGAQPPAPTGLAIQEHEEDYERQQNRPTPPAAPGSRSKQPKDVPATYPSLLQHAL
jgi:hypothetical protein